MKMRFSSLCRLRLLISSITLFLAQPLWAAESLPNQIQKWQTSDFVFETKTQLKHPFDSNVVAIFTHANTNTTYRAPLFYNGENHYVSRISLPETGNWTYTLQGDVNDLNGRTGTVKVNNSSLKGKVIIDPKTNKSFRYENGDIYNPHAYELDWLFALDQDDSDLHQTKSLISYIKKGGFNQVLMNSTPMVVIRNKAHGPCKKWIKNMILIK